LHGTGLHHWKLAEVWLGHSRVSLHLGWRPLIEELRPVLLLMAGLVRHHLLMAKLLLLLIAPELLWPALPRAKLPSLLLVVKLLLLGTVLEELALGLSWVLIPLLLNLSLSFKLLKCIHLLL